jgi:hypothetical protein
MYILNASTSLRFSARLGLASVRRPVLVLARTHRLSLARSFASNSPARSFLSRLIPPPNTGSSFRKVVSLAKPEKKPLILAVCLLLVSSSVGMTIPLTVGKLIDFFSTNSPVRPLSASPYHSDSRASTYRLDSRCIKRRASSSSHSRPARCAMQPDRTSCACLVCSRHPGSSPFGPVDSVLHQGQRIVARLRERTFEASLRQEVEFVEKGEGDVLSRLSADSSIVGERCVSLGPRLAHSRCSTTVASLKISRMDSGRLSCLRSDVRDFFLFCVGRAHGVQSVPCSIFPQH